MTRFTFKGFEPDENLKNKAERMYERMLNEIPDDALLSGQLEWDGERYHCSIEVGSRTWPAAVGMAHRFAGIALDKAELALTRKLARRLEFRYSALKGESRAMAKEAG